MAHDLKNPLAALKGAAQFLREERAQGHSIDDTREFLELMADQSIASSAWSTSTSGWGASSPCRSPLRSTSWSRPGRAAGLRRDAVDRRRDGAGAKVPECRMDRDLLAGALENLLRNAFEAMPSGAAR